MDLLASAFEAFMALDWYDVFILLLLVFISVRIQRDSARLERVEEKLTGMIALQDTESSSSTPGNRR